jgi:hypothetical protein
MPCFQVALERQRLQTRFPGQELKNSWPHIKHLRMRSSAVLTGSGAQSDLSFTRSMSEHVVNVAGKSSKTNGC